MTTSEDPQILLVGAGCAGISAALWLHDFGVPFDWVDTSGDVGGMLSRVHNGIDNYPGARFKDGQALIDCFDDHLRSCDLWPRQAVVDRVGLFDDAVSAEIAGTRRDFELLILATGTIYRRLGVPGEREGLGDWISQSAMNDAPRFAGQSVAVVGGGDSGFENARILAEQGCTVTMLLRSPEFRARRDFVDAARDYDAVEIAPIPSIIERIEPTDDGCRLFVDQSGENITYDVAALFVRIGVDPVLPAGCDALETDETGFLVVDERCQTSHDRVLAAGDITSTPLRAVATSVGQGARAARTCAARLDG